MYDFSSHAITQDLDVVEVAKAAEFFLSDGVILTGKATGEEADVEELASKELMDNFEGLSKLCIFFFFFLGSLLLRYIPLIFGTFVQK